MITLTDLNEFLDDYLNFDKKMDPSKIDPIMANGLMVRGKQEIKKIGFGVSASLGLFEKAQAEKCDAIIVHHTFNYPPYNRYDQIFQDRIAYLLKHQISLFGYHFLLDAHPEIGNNTQILKIIGAQPSNPFLHRGNPWGWIGEFNSSVTLESIVKILKKYESNRTVKYDFGPKSIKKVVAISGKGAPYAINLQDLLDNHIDLYITGEVHEWIRELFREAKINFIAAGHYATETLGVKALMVKLKSQFPQIETSWIDLANDV
ncbi:Nif3-like dinuclear metal center hexameric protein [Candidatus Gottesmanbacteria bacterium]|nr:Nif3-like dinuclear metal center hexameric protein [Candidatus Gottesmanbacteria bacterium]